MYTLPCLFYAKADAVIADLLFADSPESGLSIYRKSRLSLPGSALHPTADVLYSGFRASSSSTSSFICSIK